MKYFIILYFLAWCLPSLTYAQETEKQNIPASSQDTVLHLDQQLPSNDVWWRLFGDSTLTTLIDKAIENNYNLRNAIKNIAIARSHWRSQKGAYYPSIVASTEFTPEKSSLGIDHTEIYSRVGQAGLEMNWEIDVFGSIRKQVAYQKELYLASVEDYRGVMVSLAAEVATNYIQLRTYQQQLEVTRNNVRSQEEILQITTTKQDVGLASQLDVAQSRSLLLQTKATIPGLEANIYAQANILSVLTGEYSDDLRQVLLVPRPLPSHSGIFMEGLPAQLIRRRPDIRSAERQMDALAAAVGAARADWWPKFYLTGAIGSGNEYYKHFFRKENMTWQISPSIKWTVFSGRQITEAKRLAQLQLDEGINNYNQTLLTALQEIDNAIQSYNKSVQETEANRQALEQIQLTFQYATDLYQNGLTDYLRVLDSQRNVFNYETILVDTESNTLLAMIQLYRALGGGFGDNEIPNEKQQRK